MNRREMPVLQPTEFETVVNLRTARTLDIDAPALIVALASEVIE